MANIIDFEDLGYAIEIERSGEFMQKAVELGDHIRALPLNNAQNDELIKLIIDQIMESERTAFLQGFKTAIELKPSATIIGPEVL